jgi:pimeloyl-ACP methyl ester carboxylesterase/DNA-binding CsgD family transcriptional regulator
MKQEIRFCRSQDGTRIAYATSGSGPPLVYVANWLTHLKLDWNSPLWTHWLRELSRGHTLVRFDARGNGLSDRVVENLSVDAWAQDLAAVADDLGLERFPILGFCQGGATAIAYAVRRPERVSRLVLYNSYVHGAFTEEGTDEDKREAEALAEMIAVGWGQEAVAFRQLFANLMIPEGTLEQLRWLGKLQKRTVSPEVAVRLWRAFHAINIRRLAQQVQAPALVLHVEDNRIVDFAEGRKLATLLPDARFVPLEGKNHILLPDDPAWSRFLDEVRAFLGTETLPRATDDPRQAIARLTPREQEVLTLIARGLTNDEIAGRLTIAPKTVRNHVTHIYGKLGVDSRAQAVVLAREAHQDETTLS